MKSVDPTQAFVSVSIGEERVLELYSGVIQLLLAKQRILDTHSIPFSLRDEIDLNARILSYTDACISIISTMQKLAGIPKLDFPISHDLLRKYRDANHHIGYHSFAPYKSPDGIRFYIWPALRAIKSIKDIYPEWCRLPNRETLADILGENHEYICQLVKTAKENIFSTGVTILFHQTYRLGEISFGLSTHLNEA